MNADQSRQNPDVNTFIIDDQDPGEGPESSQDTPVPPDVEPSAPVEEPPESKGPPVGDVDDSPKRIA
jgi:hypothetical protein